MRKEDLENVTLTGYQSQEKQTKANSKLFEKELVSESNKGAVKTRSCGGS